MEWSDILFLLFLWFLLLKSSFYWLKLNALSELFQNNFIDLSTTYSNMICHKWIHYWCTICELLSFSLSLFFFFLFFSLLFISMCDCFSLSIHVSVYFFPRSSSLHWIPKLFFWWSHTYVYTPKCQNLLLYYLFEVIDIISSLSNAFTLHNDKR